MMEPNPSLLSHLDADARPRMVDVGGKTATDRVAHAQARVRFPPEVAIQLREAGFVLPKGAVLTVAHIAGVMGAKVTPQLIPLCHPLALQRCDITIDMDGDSAVVDCTVACHGTTGVEMEALTGASIAALTLYDMCKALSHAIVIEQVRLVSKRGGKSDLDHPS
ncbi:cyclic pyranopterin monophosphate synthase MoaC [Stenotrophomonas sp. NPDC047960]|jgi:cyclic pyranopterin phosphate synthase|uniref:cyclic pyranopterin monophosphate synthase MoaC n=1 Tax=Stenotrophomonas sp. NPDC047960 TaxID=3364531 RepID=UPI003713ECA4